MDGQVNIDYICIIRSNDERTVFDRCAILDTGLLSQLRTILADKDKSLLDMQDFIESSYDMNQRASLRFVIPDDYYSSYIDGASFPQSKTRAEYFALLDEVKESQKENFESSHSYLKEQNPEEYNCRLEYHLTECVNRRIDSLKSSYFSRAKQFILAKQYFATLQSIRSTPDIKMYSTETIGWSEFRFPISDDIDITIRTNFGYGASSYFRLILRYKGIDVLPFTVWTRYYHADIIEFMRCTKNYSAERKNWVDAFSFVEEVSNLSHESEQRFIEREILGEVEGMVLDLKKMVEDKKAYLAGFINSPTKDSPFFFVRNMDSADKRLYNAFPTESSTVIVLEKVSGALDFIDNLKKLSSSVTEIQPSIETILRLALSEVPNAKMMIDALDEKIKSLTSSKLQAEANYSDIRRSLAQYEKQIEFRYEELRKSDPKITRYSIEKVFSDSNPHYSYQLDAARKYQEEIAAKEQEIYLRSNFKKQLNSFIDKIEGFNS